MGQDVPSGGMAMKPIIESTQPRAYERGVKITGATRVQKLKRR